jgi:hypothetical protein
MIISNIFLPSTGLGIPSSWFSPDLSNNIFYITFFIRRRSYRANSEVSIARILRRMADIDGCTLAGLVGTNHTQSMHVFSSSFVLFCMITNFVANTYLPIYGSTALCWPLAAISVSWLYTQSVRLLGGGISPSQGCYLHTGQDTE